MKGTILTLLDCDLRVSEPCSRTVADLSFYSRAVKVPGKGAKERVVPSGEATRQALMDYLARRGELPGQRALFVTCYGET